MNVEEYLMLYYVCLLHFSAILVAILREVQCETCITKHFEHMHNFLP
jgi:hypothetical protein